MKKIFLIILIIICVLLLILLSWFFFFRSSDGPVAEIIRDVLPFGAGEDINIPAEISEEEAVSELTDESGAPIANLFRISDTPVAGAIAITKNGGPVVRYADRATGHITDASLVTLEKTKVTNTTLPKIYEAYFRADGNAVLYRSLEADTDTVSNTALTLTPPAATTTTDLYRVSAAILRGDVGEVAVGVGDTLYYTLKDSGAVVSSTFSGSSLRTLFTSKFTNWHLSVGPSLVLTTKASAAVDGYAYTLGTNGSLTKLLGPLQGLTVKTNGLGTRMLYSYVDGALRLFAQDIVRKINTEIAPATLTDKCVWSLLDRSAFYCGVPAGGIGQGEPDNWYKGMTHYSDDIWRFDMETELADILMEPKKGFGVNIDVYNPALSPNEDYLIFTNKNDMTLWALKLE